MKFQIKKYKKLNHKKRIIVMMKNGSIKNQKRQIRIKIKINQFKL